MSVALPHITRSVTAFSDHSYVMPFPQPRSATCKCRTPVVTRSSGWVLRQYDPHGSRRDVAASASKLSKEQKGKAKARDAAVGTSSEAFLPKLSQLLAETVASPLFYIAAGIVAVKIVGSYQDNEYGIFILAALPITFLTALSKTSVGKAVQESLNEKLPELEAEAAAVKQQHGLAREESVWYGDQRPLWPSQFGGGAQHLNGDLAGDYGFDPLGLGVKPEALARNAEAELVHARWAMLAAIGCLVPEVLDHAGVAIGEAVWWKVGAAKLKDDVTLNWGGIEGFRIAGRQGIWLIAACQLVLMGGPEYARYVGIRSLEPVGVFLPGDQNYPGGRPFDPFNFSGDGEGFVDQAVKEIKNGRLAMVAMLGYFVQAAVTRQGPFQNLLDFVADPVHNNIFKYLSGE